MCPMAQLLKSRPSSMIMHHERQLHTPDMMETSFISQRSWIAHYTLSMVHDMRHLMTSWILSKHALRCARTFGIVHHHHEMSQTSDQSKLKHSQNHTFQRMRWQVAMVLIFVRHLIITKHLSQ